MPGQDESLLLQRSVFEHGERGPHVVDVTAAVLGRPDQVRDLLVDIEPGGGEGPDGGGTPAVTEVATGRALDDGGGSH